MSEAEYLRRLNQIAADLAGAVEAGDRIVDRMRRHNRAYTRMTIANAIVFGGAGVVFLVHLIVQFFS